MPTVPDSNNSLERYAKTKLDLFNKTVGFAEFDLEGKIIYANEIFAKTHGYDKDEIIGVRHGSFMHVTEKKGFWEELLEKETLSGEFIRIRRDGTFFWVKSTYHVLKENGENVSVYKITTDISDQKRSELQLRQQVDTLNKAAIVSETDKNGIIQFVNHNFCEASGYSEEELIGDTHKKLKSHIQPESLFESMWNEIGVGRAWQGVICNKKKDGTFYWIHQTISPFRNLQGEIHKYVSVAFDITEQVTQKIALRQRSMALKKKHNDLSKINAELDKAYKHKTEFLANMSHELRTPLNAILLLSQLMEENVTQNLTEEQVEYAKVIHWSGSNLLELINDVLDASKLEAGKMEPHYAEFSFSSLITSINSWAVKLCQNKGLTYHHHNDQDIPESIVSDELKIHQVIKNLMSNAFKFTETGSVKLKVELESGYPTDFIVLTVSDTGIGIEKGEQEAIFEAFRQVDGTSKRKYEGTGLGLSISRRIAELLNGELKVVSEVGQGSSFIFKFPFSTSSKEIEIEWQHEKQ